MVWLDWVVPATLCAVAIWLIVRVWLPVAAPLFTDIERADDALTSPVALIVAARVAKTLVASEFTIEVASDDKPEDNVFNAVCSV